MRPRHCHASIAAFHAKVQRRCCIVDFASHLTASTPLSRVYCRISCQSTGRLCHNCCRIVDVVSHLTAPTDASIVAFHAKVQCRCCIVDVAPHLTASTSLSRVYCRIPCQSTCRLCHNYCRIVDVVSHLTAPTDASIVAFHAKVQLMLTSHHT